MKKFFLYAAATLLSLVLLGGIGVAYILLRPQERGMTPPAPNAALAPSFSASDKTNAQTAEKAPDYNLPTDFKMPTEMDFNDIPKVPDGANTVAGGNG